MEGFERESMARKRQLTKLMCSSTMLKTLKHGFKSEVFLYHIK